MRTGRVLAVDVGGTKLAAGVVTSDGTVLAEARTPTGDERDGDALFARLERLCRDVLDQAGVSVDGIGIGCGGPMEWPAGVVSPLYIPAWRGFPLKDRLGAALDHTAILDNDAKAMVLGEWWLGAGRGASDMLGMVVSTGVGGGLIVGGSLANGASGNAGHVGHVNVWPDGPECSCGARGCLGAIASGTGLARRYREATGRNATASDIADFARRGEATAASLFRDAARALGRGIASATVLLDLERVVVGGSIGVHAWDLIGEALEAELRATARVTFARDVRVLRAELGERAGLFGAAALALGVIGTLE